MNTSAQLSDAPLSCTAILDAMPVGVAVLTAEGTLASSNLTFARLMDTDRDGLLHTPMHQLLDLTAAAVRAALAECDILGEATLPPSTSPAGHPLMVHLSAVFADGHGRRVLTLTPLPPSDTAPGPTAVAAAPRVDERPPCAPLPPTSESSERRLLLVEDDAVVAMVARAHLEQLGLTVDVASTGRRAMELTEVQTYQWVILDCILPDVEGIAVFEHLRHLPEPRRPTRIIATSGMQAGALPGAMSGAPVDAILPKPLSPNAIHAALGIERPRPSAQAGAHTAFDLQTIESIRALPGGASFMDDVLQAFLSDVSEAHAFLAGALGDQDFRAIARTAHRLQGAAAAVGAHQIERRCSELQCAAHEQRLGPLALSITQFAEEVRSVELALSDFYQ